MVEDSAIARLRHDAAKRVSDYFQPHPDQIVTVYRGDLQFLLDEYDSLRPLAASPQKS